MLWSGFGKLTQNTYTWPLTFLNIRVISEIFCLSCNRIRPEGWFLMGWFLSHSPSPCHHTVSNHCPTLPRAPFIIVLNFFSLLTIRFFSEYFSANLLPLAFFEVWKEEPLVLAVTNGDCLSRKKNIQKRNKVLSNYKVFDAPRRDVAE